jgi:hypothetical protein
MQVDCEVGRPKVNYRETIQRRAEFDYLHKKQSGGSGACVQLAEADACHETVCAQRLRAGAECWPDSQHRPLDMPGRTCAACGQLLEWH